MTLQILLRSDALTAMAMNETVLQDMALYNLIQGKTSNLQSKGDVIIRQ